MNWPLRLLRRIALALTVERAIRCETCGCVDLIHTNKRRLGRVDGSNWHDVDSLGRDVHIFVEIRMSKAWRAHEMAVRVAAAGGVS
jgi:hypothetical protein